jgi:exopolysaccharide biosynthesis protein
MTSKRLALILIFFFASGSALAADWKSIAPGLDYQEFAEGNIDVHVARIDLTSDNLMVVTTRESEKGLKVSDYAKKNKALVAINGDYFDDKFNPVGLTIGPCGQWANTKDTSREGIVAVGSLRADIRKQSEVMDPPEDWIQTAISGWPILVKECTPLTATELPGSDVFTRSPHPRTAVGMTKDRKTLYLVVADGRRTGVPGMKLADLGTFMHDRLDACWAINLDGGGSSAMWVGDKVVNRPSDGVERRVADHLAVILKSDFAGCDVPPAGLVTTTTTTTKTTTTVTTTTSTQR